MSAIRRSCALLLLAACTSDDAESAADAGMRDMDVDASSGAIDAVGRFELTLVAAVPATADLPATPAFTSVLGRVFDRAVPADVTWTVTAEEGACSLLEPSIPACDPACASTEVCTESDGCVPYPRSLDLGSAALRGLEATSGEDAITMEPLPPSNSYQLPRSVQLAYPPFAEGDAIRLDTEGGELSALSIETSAIAPLELGVQGPLRFSADSATELRWTAPAGAGESRIQVRVDISHHGGQKGEIVCDTEDTGSLEIPAALGASLIDLGVAGFPSLEIARTATGSIPVGRGTVELVLESPLTVDLDIPGLVSCEEPGMQDVCPDGQQCQPDLRCR